MGKSIVVLVAVAVLAGCGSKSTSRSGGQSATAAWDGKSTKVEDLVGIWMQTSPPRDGAIDTQEIIIIGADKTYVGEKNGVGKVTNALDILVCRTREYGTVAIEPLNPNYDKQAAFYGYSHVADFELVTHGPRIELVSSPVNAPNCKSLVKVDQNSQLRHFKVGRPIKMVDRNTFIDVSYNRIFKRQAQ